MTTVPNAPHELARYTTMRVGGPAAELVVASTPEELACAVREADAAGTPVFVLGGGSNALVGDAGFDGRVVLTRGGRIVLRELGGGARRAHRRRRHRLG